MKENEYWQVSFGDPTDLDIINFPMGMDLNEVLPALAKRRDARRANNITLTKTVLVGGRPDFVRVKR